MRAFTAIVAAAMATAAPARADERLLAGAFAQQQSAMASGRESSESLTRAYLARIEAMDRQGPRLNSVIALNPNALADARRLDAERRAGRVRGPLHGVAILVKDNIDTNDGTATTAGSLALKDNVTGRDAPLVARLKAQGVVVLGKTNLSEWANYRSSRSISGWSAVGGLVRNPYALDRGACGSSSGSGAAIAAAFAAGAIGTETDGSIVCPATMNGLVGLKPTVGLVSRTHVVPISASQDTAGPMTRSVADAAALLNALAGTDPADDATVEADARKADYLAALRPDALKGVRIGVVRNMSGRHPEIDAVYEAAIKILAAQGAVLVPVKLPETAAISEAENTILKAEFKAGVAAYLASTDPGKVKPRTLADLIAFNDSNASREMPLFGQELFIVADAAPALTDAAYLKAKADGRRLAGPEGIDKWLGDAKVEMLIGITGGPAPRVDPVNGVRWLGGFSGPAAVAGYPHLTVPMGMVSGLPVGLSFVGTAWSEARLLAVGYSFEQASKARVAPTFASSVDLRPEIAAAYDPKP